MSGLNLGVDLSNLKGASVKGYSHNDNHNDNRNDNTSTTSSNSKSLSTSDCLLPNNGVNGFIDVCELARKMFEKKIFKRSYLGIDMSVDVHGREKDPFDMHGVKTGLQKMCDHFGFPFRKDKNISRSDWNRESLSRKQVIYGCEDAWFTLRVASAIGKDMSNLGFNFYFRFLNFLSCVSCDVCFISLIFVCFKFDFMCLKCSEVFDSV